MKKAFSLIELLIVILIIGIIYTLSIGNFKKIKDAGEVKLSLKNLKEYLQNIEHQHSVEILCVDECASCDIFVDTEKFTSKSIENFLDKSVKVYRYDFNLGMVEKEFKNGVCFSFDVDKKGVSSQYIVEYDSKVYDYTTYLDDTKVYNSLQEVSEVKENLAQEILR
jgi:prepilin-type N-terminal cleavage/methylation domain-containing protein